MKEVRFSEQKFSANTSVSNIKYHYPRLQIKNSFYPFHNQLAYALANYFVESETTKDSLDKFLSKLLITPITKPLFLWIENKSAQNFV